MQTWGSRNSPWSAMLLIFLFSTLDAVLTVQGIEAGVYREMNPLMEYFITVGYGIFFTAKSLMVGTGLFLLGYWWKYKIAKIGAGIVFSTYVAILFLHATNIITMVVR